MKNLKGVCFKKIFYWKHILHFFDCYQTKYRYFIAKVEAIANPAYYNRGHCWQVTNLKIQVLVHSKLILAGLSRVA